jgi:hypothetical protein
MGLMDDLLKSVAHGVVESIVGHKVSDKSIDSLGRAVLGIVSTNDNASNTPDRIPIEENTGEEIEDDFELDDEDKAQIPDEYSDEEYTDAELQAEIEQLISHLQEVIYNTNRLLNERRYILEEKIWFLTAKN